MDGIVERPITPHTDRDDQVCIPETPKKDEEELQTTCDDDTLELRPEFKILLNVREHSSPESPENERSPAVKNLCSLLNRERPALLSLHNKNVLKSDEMSPQHSPHSRKRSSKAKKSGVGHAIKKPKTSSSHSSAPLSDSLKAILAKKKAFSVSTNDDKDIVKIQSDVCELLDTLDEPLEVNTECSDDIYTEQLEAIDTLINIVSVPGVENPTSAKPMGESEMEELLDNLLGTVEEISVDSSNMLDTGSGCEQSLEELEQMIGRIETVEEDLFEDESVSPENEVKQHKLFPVFIKGATEKYQKSDCVSTSTKSSIILPFRSVGDKEQMILDAGQKKYGQVECPGCQCVYDPDDRADVENHLQYHNRQHASLKYFGWKNERVVTVYPDGAKVIQIVKGDPQLWWKRVNEVLTVVDSDLGFAKDDVSHSNKERMVFLYINNKQILGCLVAEDIERANKMLDMPEPLSSEEYFPVSCGISRIWTAGNARRKGVASKLVDCMRENFLSFKTLDLNEFAFSSPSVSGREFAAKYTGTPCFLVYQ